MKAIPPLDGWKGVSQAVRRSSLGPRTISRNALKFSGHKRALALPAVAWVLNLACGLGRLHHQSPQFKLLRVKAPGVGNLSLGAFL
jgi:hypothetical protein